MSFFGGRGITGHTLKFQPIATQDCVNLAQAIQANDLKRFNLTQIAPYTYTNNSGPINVAYSWCCSDYVTMTAKIIVRLLPTVYNFHTKRFFSPSMPVQDCDVKQLFCVLDNNMLVWLPNSYDNCELILGNTVIGEQHGDHIVSSQGQLAVTLTGKTELVCNIRVHQTVEGIFVSIVEHTNQPMHNLSVMLCRVYRTSNEFLTMSYVSQQLQEMLENKFESNWLAICNVRRSQYYEMKNMAASAPTLIVRSLLQNENIIAELRGDVITVYPCVQITDYYFRNET